MEPIQQIRDQEIAAIEEFAAKRDAMLAEIRKVIVGQEKAVEEVLIGLFSKGHCLLVGVPGLAKTLLISTLAEILHLEFNRIQFTPDLMPSDITGTDILQEDASTGRRKFQFMKGPVFTNILLADEINRASPRTQSALLEVMAEGQVSVEGRTHAMDPMFFVVATQNPVEFRGTYPLPEAQMDRFALCLALGYVDADTEVAVLSAQDLRHPLEAIGAVASHAEVLALKEAARRVRVADELKHYVVELVRRTRAAPQVLLGCGPRASIALAHTAKALALFDGEEFVRPEHVQELAVATLAHRMVLDPQARFAGVSAASLVGDLLREVKVPA